MEKFSLSSVALHIRQKEKKPSEETRERESEQREVERVCVCA